MHGYQVLDILGVSPPVGKRSNRRVEYTGSHSRKPVNTILQVENNGLIAHRGAWGGKERPTLEEVT